MLQDHSSVNRCLLMITRPIAYVRVGRSSGTRLLALPSSFSPLFRCNSSTEFFLVLLIADAAFFSAALISTCLRGALPIGIFGGAILVRVIDARRSCSAVE
ncbi:uncharacterized protein EV420DRAFT_1509005 [Desarmillaria tabescens]|uniref:Uncharacterized protein n=1 Tax=Armillaria tabescens TaxID=1929756 RepID=A0AA39NHY5_ARMTA|nr:uncharacterized protein EV420DRAFT_1509005 [Desarmillaria tabescens]KAK0465962.1 hypothetical protein EV420DRAFT_1509005 [Desarmillaria tabescens]